MKQKAQSRLRIFAGACLLSAAVLHHPANAGMVSTEDASGAAPAREQIDTFLARPEVAKQLQDLGVPPEEARARADAMTDEEIRHIAGQLGALPAGGALSNYELLLVLLLIVILAVVL